jgi:hypothetical protein
MVKAGDGGMDFDVERDNPDPEAKRQPGDHIEQRPPVCRRFDFSDRPWFQS